MNKYRKKFSKKKRRNTMRKTFKKNKYRKLSRKINMILRKNLALKKRYQIGCSRKNNIMNGGGVLPFQALNDLVNNTQHMFDSTLSTTLGTTPEQSPNPTTTTTTTNV